MLRRGINIVTHHGRSFTAARSCSFVFFSLRSTNLRIILFAITLLPALIGKSQSFEDYTETAGIDVLHYGGVFGNGVSFADFNQDGWDDITFAVQAEDPVFYQNNQGVFEEIDLGISNENSADTKAIQWVDYDNDSDLDLLITYNHFPVKLYNNDGNLNLTDVTDEAGIVPQYVRHYGSSWADYDKDGDLDLYLCKYHNPIFSQGYQYTNHLYQNNGDGTFTDVTDFAGVGDGVKASFQSIFFDYDHDGWEDLYIINDRYNLPNSMYHNNGDGTFTNTSLETNTGISIDAMTATAGDYDRDEDIDIYITDNYSNIFFENNGDGTFSNIAEELGVEINLISWAAIWLDYDNNMLEDLHVAIQGNTQSINAQNIFFENLVDSFVEIHDSIGLSGDEYGTYTMAVGDINNDGYPDFVENNIDTHPCVLYKNSGGSNNWLKVGLQGVVSNRDGIGSWIKAYTDTITQTRYTHLGECYMAQHSRREMFGLAEFEEVDSLIVHWPSGIIDKLYNLNVNQTLEIIEGESQSVEVNIEGDPEICPGDSIVLSADEADAYLWSTGHDGQYISIQQAGEYYLSINSNGLWIPSDTVTVSQLPPPAIELEITDVSCFGHSDGSIFVQNNNGNGIDTILWDGDLTGATVSGLSAGYYQFLLTDLNGCEASGIAEVEEPSEIVLDLVVNNQSADENGSAILMIQGGTSPYSTYWSTGEEQILSVDNLSPGSYSVLVIDSNDCQKEINFVVDEYISVAEYSHSEIFVFPNPTDRHLTVSGASAVSQIQIFNIQGQKIKLPDSHIAHGPENTLHLDLSHLNSGIYTFLITRNETVIKVLICKE